MPAKKKKKSRSRHRTAPVEAAEQTTVDLSNDAEYEALIAAMGGSDLCQLEPETDESTIEKAKALSKKEISEQSITAVTHHKPGVVGLCCERVGAVRSVSCVTQRSVL